MNDYRHFHVERDEGGVLTAALDVQDKAMNVFDAEVLAELESIVSDLEGDSAASVVVFRSGKDSGFLAGADVNQIAALDDEEDVMQIVARGQELFNRIAGLPMPTVAVIHGPCLGGGLEFALACDYRIARNDSATRLGLPEIKLGLVPAWGGTQRLPRLIGPAAALPMILQGSQLPAVKALRSGLVDLAPAPAEFEAAVNRFVSRLADEDSFTNPRRTSLSSWLMNRTRLGRWFVLRTAARKIERATRNYPALGEAVEAVRVGLSRSMEAGLQREREAFARLLFTPACRNLLGLFFQRERARDVATWVDHSSERDPVAANLSRIGVIGAGAMGAGIAQLAAYQGFQVVLKEIDEEALAAGMARIRKLFDDAVRNGRLSREEADQRLAAIAPTIEWEPLADVDVAIEAVVERADVKRRVFAELEQRLKETALLVSNTSSLSVNDLGLPLNRPERLAGLHFFNPVHRMELVEVVRTPATDDTVIETLVRLVRRLGKTPLVVNDSPGFLVNRILFPYLAEAVQMVREGIGVESIDRQMKKFGMPMGPLELLDQVGLDIAAHVADSMSATVEEAGRTAEFLKAMVERGQLGKKSGCGFYEYERGRRTRPAEVAGKPERIDDTSPAVLERIERRLVLPVINEAARCLEEHVAAKPWMVDLAMVLGTGFAPFRGGPLRLADEMGTSLVVEELNRLWDWHDGRFTPCNMLAELATWNGTFYEAASGAPVAAGAP